MDSVTSGPPYTFQQDSTPAHKAKLVQSWLKKNVPNFWDFNTRPPTAPTCTHATTSCREVGEEVCAMHHNNVASLKASIKSEMHKLDPGRSARSGKVQVSFGGHP
ncbi:Transposable element tcb1 transposase [Caligus rogercresseyi]|uniref:Transposable element tcb1 transposase n=1 Tax=Caligus rogercresseyi TaxID=217165 RepID=A0A7T8JUK3_CALRO|nr:Transposable element tcb1 transposase [Caligus rogercresseyi]